MGNTPERTYASHISVNLTNRRLSHFEGARQVNIYPVGVGKQATPTPTGNYSVIEKIMHPGGMLGTRWIGISIPGGNYGIHGTNNPSSIGGYVSNGCIRMHNHDVEVLFPKVHIGMPVKIETIMTNPGDKPGAQQSGKLTHTVQAGESLWEISRRYGKDLAQLIQANNIQNPDVIYPGQIITIPS